MRIGIRILTLGVMILFPPVVGLSADEEVTLENAVSPGPNRADEPFAEESSMQKAIRFLDSMALTW